MQSVYYKEFGEVKLQKAFVMLIDCAKWNECMRKKRQVVRKDREAAREECVMSEKEEIEM